MTPPPATESLAPDPLAPGEGGFTPCTACGAPVSGRFCSACGERRPSADDERLAPFLREQWQEATSADGKLWATLKALFVPGKLTEEFFAGRRGRYVRPVRVFLVANVLFFLSLSTVGGGTSSFLGAAEIQRGDGPYGAWATAQLTRASVEAGVSQPAYDAAFDQKSATLATTLVGLIVPLLALVLAIALFRHRVSGVRHLVFATHYVAFAMAASVVAVLLLVPAMAAAAAADWTRGWNGLARAMDPAVMVLLVLYLTVALRRVYTMPWRTAALTTLLVVVLGSPLVTTVYRFALFVVALWTTEVPTV